MPCNILGRDPNLWQNKNNTTKMNILYSSSIDMVHYVLHDVNNAQQWIEMEKGKMKVISQKKSTHL